MAYTALDAALGNNGERLARLVRRARNTDFLLISQRAAHQRFADYQRLRWLDD